jgi:glycine/D-amino acid oxidase-like deaminating enzyme
MLDYLVVGLGLAGIALCETLESNGKSFLVIDNPADSASLVAGGVYNPVVLKRLKLAWNAKEQMPLVVPFYSGLERKLGVQFHHPGTVFRRIATVEEQNKWFEAADTAGLKPFMQPRLVPNWNPNLNAPLGFGAVIGTGRIDTRTLIKGYAVSLKHKACLLEANFEHDLLYLEETGFAYRGLRARKIVFATGTGLNDNPYFNYLPLQGNKGEYLHIHCPGLREEEVIKAAVFLIPNGNDQYTAGATYDHRDTGKEPTPVAKAYLESKLGEILNCPYEITGQVAGIRPTVADRRPLVGEHPSIRNMFVLNGFGSRGVMIAPYAASQLYRTMEFRESPDPEMDIARFTKKYFSETPL